jgi:hypothetical protein
MKRSLPSWCYQLSSTLQSEHRRRRAPLWLDACQSEKLTNKLPRLKLKNALTGREKGKVEGENRRSYSLGTIACKRITEYSLSNDPNIRRMFLQSKLSSSKLK